MIKIIYAALVTLASAFTATSAQAAANYAQTKYPIVLAHGWMAIQFNGIAEALRADGAKVFITQTSSQNSAEVRGEQLVKQIRAILAVTGAEKVNIIAHSQGTQDSRYAASVLPNQVASITAVAGMVKGSLIADGLGQTDGTPLGDVLASVFEAIGKLSAYGHGDPSLPQSAVGALHSMTTAGANAFNMRHPAGVPTSACGQGAAVVNGIRYYSWTGSKKVTNVFDPSDYLLGITGSLYGSAPNDGLVGACSAHLGNVIRDNYPLNHLDQINQLFGLGNIFINVKSLYRQHANRLKLSGL
ncbi:MAG: hypothetical protein RLZZ618_719 [Pseudomonadota bacterium]|jgi:triacylglycerol lipase